MRTHKITSAAGYGRLLKKTFKEDELTCRSCGKRIKSNSGFCYHVKYFKHSIVPGEWIVRKNVYHALCMTVYPFCIQLPGETDDEELPEKFKRKWKGKIPEKGKGKKRKV